MWAPGSWRLSQGPGPARGIGVQRGCKTEKTPVTAAIGALLVGILYFAHAVHSTTLHRWEGARFWLELAGTPPCCGSLSEQTKKSKTQARQAPAAGPSPTESGSTRERWPTCWRRDEDPLRTPPAPIAGASPGLAGRCGAAERDGEQKVQTPNPDWGVLTHMSSEIFPRACLL